MTSNDIVHGEDFIIEILVGDTYKVILCATDGTLTYQQEIIKTTTEDSGIWTGKAPRLNEVTLSVSGLTPINDDATHVSWFYMMSDAVRTIPQNIRATFRNDNGESKVISGTAIISGGEITGNADDFASSTIDMEFSGAVIQDSDVSTSPVTTPLTTPNITFTYISDTQINVAWAAVPNADYYILRQSRVNDITFATVKSTGTNLYYPSTRLTPDTTYYFWLEAVGSGIYSNSARDTDNATTTAAAAVTIQLAPPSFSMVANGTTQIDATWSSVNHATGYEYYFNTVDDLGTATLEYTGTLLTKSKTGLTAGTTYYGWVIALGDGTTYLDSDPASASATTDAIDPTSEVFDTILTNSAGTSDEGAGIHAYFVFSFFSSVAKELHFNAPTTPLSQNNIRLVITIGGSPDAVIDFPGNYAGQYYRYMHDGTAYTATFPSTNSTQAF
jgi:predicted secreted protein